MDDEFRKQKDDVSDWPILLQFAAEDDLEMFKLAVIDKDCDIDGVYKCSVKKNGSSEIKFLERTPLMIAAENGSVNVLKYILESHRVDVNRASLSDGATALKCAETNGCSAEMRSLILSAASAKPALANTLENQPINPIPCSSSREQCGVGTSGERHVLSDQNHNQIEGQQRKRDNSMNLLYIFKIENCLKPFEHFFKSCGYRHHEEYYLRRDPRTFTYSPFLCHEFMMNGTCPRDIYCENAHGKIEQKFHPSIYRTEICQKGPQCAQKFCTFAHSSEELREHDYSHYSQQQHQRSVSSQPIWTNSLAPFSHDYGNGSHYFSGTLRFQAFPMKNVAPSLRYPAEIQIQQTMDSSFLERTHSSRAGPSFTSFPTSIHPSFHDWVKKNWSYRLEEHNDYSYNEGGMVNQLPARPNVPASSANWHYRGGQLDRNYQGGEQNMVTNPVSFRSQNNRSNTIGDDPSSDPFSFLPDNPFY